MPSIETGLMAAFLCSSLLYTCVPFCLCLVPKDVLCMVRPDVVCTMNEETREIWPGIRDPLSPTPSPPPPPPIHTRSSSPVSQHSFQQLAGQGREAESVEYESWSTDVDRRRDGYSGPVARVLESLCFRVSGDGLSRVMYLYLHVIMLLGIHKAQHRGLAWDYVLYSTSCQMFRNILGWSG